MNKKGLIHKHTSGKFFFILSDPYELLLVGPKPQRNTPRDPLSPIYPSKEPSKG